MHRDSKIFKSDWLLTLPEKELGLYAFWNLSISNYFSELSTPFPYWGLIYRKLLEYDFYHFTWKSFSLSPLPPRKEVIFLLLVGVSGTVIFQSLHHSGERLCMWHFPEILRVELISEAFSDFRWTFSFLQTAL